MSQKLLNLSEYYHTKYGVYFVNDGINLYIHRKVGDESSKLIAKYKCSEIYSQSDLHSIEREVKISIIDNTSM